MADTAPQITFEEPTIGGQTVEQVAAAQVQQPGLPPGTEQTTVDLQEQPGEILDPAVADIAPIVAPTPAAAPTATVSDANLANLLDISPETLDAYSATAEQGTVTPESLLRFQMEQFMGDVESGDAPWADAAMRKANELMLRRGLGASTMAGAAISTAILEAAVPLAQYDAGVYGQMNLQNLRNRHETLLSNASAENAARQFNASSTNEINKYMSDMRDRVYRFNSEQSNMMGKFNTEQENSMGMFYDKMQNETDKFISENKTLIARSNVEWRRAINTANTSAQNAAIQQNVQNRFNMSQQAMADLWQRSRDVFDWANKSAENSRDRAYNLTMYTMKRADFLKDVDTDQKNQFWQGVGKLATDIIGDASKSLIDNWME